MCTKSFSVDCERRFCAAVIHGAGGMMLVDPLFQRILIAECKERKIPVIFDEVFAGCWRLGVQVR